MNRKRFAAIGFLTGLLLLAASMPLSVFGMSLAQFFLVGSWLLEGRVLERLRLAFAQRTVLVLTGVFFIHLAGILYSTDLNYAFKDLRIKLPLLLLPVLLSTPPQALSDRMRLMLPVLLAALFVSTLISFGVLYGVLPHEGRLHDIRDASVFISHIRLSLLICFSLFLTLHFARIIPARTGQAAAILLAGWFLFFLYRFESMTGFSVLFISGSLLLLRHALTRNKIKFLVPAALITIAVPGSVWLFLKKEAPAVYMQRAIDYESLDRLTPGGRKYTHFPDRTEQENANPVWIYVCEHELENEWNRRSQLPFEGNDRQGHELRYTLVRFLASKGLRKDSAGVAALTNDEITAVESSIANVEYMRLGSLRQRIRKSIKEYYMYRAGENPTGSSLMQHLEYLKTGWSLFKGNWLTGVGTGDVQMAFDREYERSGTRLAPEHWHRAHNQFLTFGLTFGLFGLAYFIFSLIYPLLKHRPGNRFLYEAFCLIAALSFLTEDTLETQAGVTFFAFLNSFFLFLDGPSTWLDSRPDSPQTGA